MRQVKGATEDGIRYLDLKHTLLLNYCRAIFFYLTLKAEAEDVRDHPVVGRLVDLKLSIKGVSVVTFNIILCSQFMGSFTSISCENEAIDLMNVLSF